MKYPLLNGIAEVEKKQKQKLHAGRRKNHRKDKGGKTDCLSITKPNKRKLQVKWVANATWYSGVDDKNFFKKTNIHIGK